MNTFWLLVGGFLYGIITFATFQCLLLSCGAFLTEVVVVPEIEWLEEYRVKDGFDGLDILIYIVPKALRWRLLEYFCLAILWPIIIPLFLILLFRRINEPEHNASPWLKKPLEYILGGFGKYKEAS